MCMPCNYLQANDSLMILRVNTSDSTWNALLYWLELNFLVWKTKKKNCLCTQKFSFFSGMLFQIGVAKGRKGKEERGNSFSTQAN
jgi:hypothetical protein